jgi:hypothetical protein
MITLHISISGSDFWFSISCSSRQLAAKDVRVNIEMYSESPLCVITSHFLCSTVADKETKTFFSIFHCVRTVSSIHTALFTDISCSATGPENWTELQTRVRRASISALRCLPAKANRPSQHNATHTIIGMMHGITSRQLSREGSAHPSWHVSDMAKAKIAFSQTSNSISGRCCSRS